MKEFLQNFHQNMKDFGSDIASYNDANISSREVEKAKPQSFALVSRSTYLIH